MAYKDKDKQREAVKAATRRYRGKKGDSALSGSKAVSQNAPESSVLDEVSDTLPVIPSKSVIPVIPLEYQRGGGFVVPDKLGPLKPKQGSTGITRLVAPNTSDTVILKDESHVDASDIGAVKALHQAINKPKRGKDIKVFEDLPPDVQRTIDYMSRDSEGRPIEYQKANRTAIAINYQHQFPDRYHSTGVV